MKLSSLKVKIKTIKKTVNFMTLVTTFVRDTMGALAGQNFGHFSLDLI